MMIFGSAALCPGAWLLGWVAGLFDRRLVTAGQRRILTGREILVRLAKEGGKGDRRIGYVGVGRFCFLFRGKTSLSGD